MTALILPRSLLAAMEQAARTAWPNECCGLLVGRKSAEAGGWRVEQWHPAANIHPESRRHFELDPAVHFAVLRQLRQQARDGGLAVIGHAHSHPNGSASPSATDRALAFDPDLLWLIIGMDTAEATTTQAWQPPADHASALGFTPLTLILDEDLPSS